MVTPNDILALLFAIAFVPSIGFAIVLFLEAGREAESARRQAIENAETRGRSR